jgi:hypothetical protein
MLGKDKVLCKTNYVQNKHNLYYKRVGSPLEHGCNDGKFGLEPILFEGQMLSDFLQDLVCNGRSVCSKGCVCFEHKALILVFGLDRLNHAIRDKSLN